MKIILFALGWIFLLSVEIGRVYFIMPFPGSQESNTLALAYWIHSNLGTLRLIGLVAIAWPLYSNYLTGSRQIKTVIGVLLLIYGLFFYLFNFRFLAEKMFYQPTEKIMSTVADNKVSLRQLVLGIVVGEEARAYPIEIIGYHHQVRDSIGRFPTMITYCTVCRTGRIYSPRVGSELENFRLVGMDHYNAMFEDSKTGSWWRQANGEAVAGPLAGWRLTEFPSEQMTLESWIRQHPQTRILQADKMYKDEYEELSQYDEGEGKGRLTGTDSISWHDKSWVIGVSQGLYARAYDWNDVLKYRVINDQLAGKPLLIALESDSASFHTFSRLVENDTLNFVWSDSSRALTDNKYGSVWDLSGTCIAGKWQGKKLLTVQSYQEFWHSWRTFHPNTSQFVYENEEKVQAK